MYMYDIQDCTKIAIIETIWHFILYVIYFEDQIITKFWIIFTTVKKVICIWQTDFSLIELNFLSIAAKTISN